jgi:hypothetical protein
MSGSWTPDTEERRGLPLGGLALMVAGVLAVGGGVGLALNRTTAPQAVTAEVIPGDPATDPQTPPSTSAESAPAPTLVRSVAAGPRLVEATPPENPFLRTVADPVAFAPADGSASFPAAVAGTSKPASPAAAVAAASVTAPTQPARPAAPAKPNADDLALTGIVQGDPPVAVVRYSGQSLFLKIGDQVADTWRLVEFKERSAIFQLGAQRVEIPIKGGSSE